MFSKRRTLIASATAIAIAAAGTQAAHAEPAYGTGVELNTTMANTVEVPTTVNLGASRTEGITALRELRAEMWEKNPPFYDWGRGGTLQGYAKSLGLDTKQKYVDAVFSDKALVAIAVQRAVEESVGSGKRNHKRPYNESCTLTASQCASTSSATFLGFAGGAENLAWGWNEQQSLSKMILEQWGREEYQALLDAKGVFDNDNGHLHNMLNPTKRAFGFGHVNAQDKTKQYAITGAMAAKDTGSGLVDDLPDKVQTINLYRSVHFGETPTGITPIEVVAGEKLNYKHTASLWGGSSQEWTAPADAAGKSFNVTFSGTFPDGTVTKETVPVRVKKSLSEEIGLKYSSGTSVTEGQTVTIPVANGIKVPDGTKFSPSVDWAKVDETTGELTVTAPRVSEDTSRNFAVGVVYSDGSETTVTVPLQVLNSQADKYPFQSPKASYDVVEERELRVDLSSALTKVAKVEPSIGHMDGTTWIYQAIAVDRDMQVSPSFELTYEDGSTGNGNLTVYVKNRQSDSYQPRFEEVEPALEGSEVRINLQDPQFKPQGITFDVESDEVEASFEDDAVVFTAPEVDDDTTATIRVIATYSDDSYDEIDFEVPILNRQSDKYDPQFKEIIEVLELTEKAVDFSDLVAKLPKGTTLSSLDNLDFDSSTNILHLHATHDADQTYRIPLSMKVSYPDGSEDIFEYTVRYLNRLADENDPKFPENNEVFEGKVAEITLPTSVVLPEDTTITVDNGAVVEGRTIKWTAPTIDEAFAQQLNVTFTYKDGSVDRQTISVTVKNSLAEDNKPDTREIVSPSVREGETATIDLNSVLESLPDGTELKPREGEIENGVLKLDTNQVTETETKTVPVDVVYTDGSKNTIEVKIEVKDSIADTFKPQYEDDASVSEHGQSTFSAGVSLPANTTVRIADQVSGASVDPTTGAVTYRVGELNGDSTSVIKLEFRFEDGSVLHHDLSVALKDTTPPEEEYKPLFPTDKPTPDPEVDPVTPPTSDDPTPDPEENPLIPPASDDEEEGSSVGAIVGIIVAVLAVIGGIAAAVGGSLNGSFSFRIG